jgi:beta-mannanase
MCSGSAEFAAQFTKDLVHRANTSAPAGGLNGPKTTDVRSTMVRFDGNGKQMMWSAEGDASQMGGLAESFLNNKRKAEDEIDPAVFNAVVKENTELKAEIAKLNQTNSKLRAAIAAYTAP